MKSRERESSQKAYKIHQFRQGWVGEKCETHKRLCDSGEPESGQKGFYSVFVKKKASCPQRGGRIGAAEKAIYRVIERISTAIYIYIPRVNTCTYSLYIFTTTHQRRPYTPGFCYPPWGPGLTRPQLENDQCRQQCCLQGGNAPKRSIPARAVKFPVRLGNQTSHAYPW